MVWREETARHPETFTYDALLQSALRQGMDQEAAESRARLAYSCPAVDAGESAQATDQNGSEEGT